MWRDLFSPRQLLCHGTSVEVFREMLDADRADGKLNEVRQAAYGYLALTLDTLLNYNSRSGIVGHSNRPRRAPYLLSTRFLIQVVLCGDGASRFRCGLRLGHQQDRQMHPELVALVRPKVKGDAGGLFDDADAVEYHPATGDHHLQAGRQPRPHRRRQHRRGGHGSALLRQRHVR